MSYSRDKDAYTRGSGAIAAADYGNPRRARERAERLIRSELRDSHLADFTLGPRGGMGAATSTIVGGNTGLRSVTWIEGGLIEGAGKSPMGRPRQPTGGKLPPKDLPPLPPRKPPPIPPYRPGGSPQKGSSTVAERRMAAADPGRGYTPPVLEPPPPASKRELSRTRASGGGSTGGGGGGGGGGVPPLPQFPTTPPRDLSLIDPEAVAQGAKKPPWLLIALGVGAAYLLLRDDEKKGTTP